MALRTRKTVIFAKVETTYGTDAAPTGGANAIQVSNPKLSPLQGQDIERNLVTHALGQQPTIKVGAHVMLDFEVEASGSGTPGTAPAYGPLLRGCGMGETITLDTSAVYAPLSSGHESLTLHFYMDGNRHVLLGARGTFSLSISPKEIPRYKFSFAGLWADPAAVALPTPESRLQPDWPAWAMAPGPQPGGRSRPRRAWPQSIARPPGVQRLWRGGAAGRRPPRPSWAKSTPQPHRGPWCSIGWRAAPPASEPCWLRGGGAKGAMAGLGGAGSADAKAQERLAGVITGTTAARRISPPAWSTTSLASPTRCWCSSLWWRG